MLFYWYSAQHYLCCAGYWVSLPAQFICLWNSNHNTILARFFIIDLHTKLLVLDPASAVHQNSINFVLGISNFDLLGEFGRQEWLANFYLILFYNLMFGMAATLCLVKKSSASVRQEIFNKISNAFTRDRRSHSMNESKYLDWTKSWTQCVPRTQLHTYSYKLA